MSDRPKIPAEIERGILIEAGHRCAVCGTSLPLERAHIIPWSKAKEHRAENLICMCANCHERSEKEKWGTKTLKEYKSRPWVNRQAFTPNDINQEILNQSPSITLDIDHDYFTIDEVAERWKCQPLDILRWAQKDRLSLSIDIPELIPTIYMDHNNNHFNIHYINRIVYLAHWEISPLLLTQGKTLEISRIYKNNKIRNVHWEIGNPRELEKWSPFEKDSFTDLRMKKEYRTTLVISFNDLVITKEECDRFEKSESGEKDSLMIFINHLKLIVRNLGYHRDSNSGEAQGILRVFFNRNDLNKIQFSLLLKEADQLHKRDYLKIQEKFLEFKSFVDSIETCVNRAEKEAKIGAKGNITKEYFDKCSENLKDMIRMFEEDDRSL